MTCSYIRFLNEVHSRNWLWSKSKSSPLLCPLSKKVAVTFKLVQVESPDDAVLCGVLFVLCFLRGYSDCAE